MGRNAALADPFRLKPFDRKNKELLRVVIETPKGSRNKFAFNTDDRTFELKKVLPADMEFPYDFGFVPSILAPDGDPVDVLVTHGRARLFRVRSPCAHRSGHRGRANQRQENRT